MSDTSQAFSAIAGWPTVEPDLVARHGVGPGSLLLRSVAAVFRTKIRMLEALQRSWRRRPTGNGGPPAPSEDQQVYDSIWDDPLLWMLMMH